MLSCVLIFKWIRVPYVEIYGGGGSESTPRAWDDISEPGSDRVKGPKNTKWLRFSAPETAKKRFFMHPIDICPQPFASLACSSKVQRRDEAFRNF